MDQHFITLLKHKNTKAQKELYVKLAEQIFVLILRYINDADEAKNLVNNTFIKAFEKIESFILQDKNSLLAWIKKIAVNESLMFLRTQKRLINIDDIPESQHPSANCPEADLTAREYLQLVQALPVGYRTVFNMFAIEGYSHAEIATELNISESTSRSQLTRAREILKKQINVNF